MGEAGRRQSQGQVRNKNQNTWLHKWSKTSQNNYLLSILRLSLAAGMNEDESVFNQQLGAFNRDIFRLVRRGA